MGSGCGYGEVPGLGQAWGAVDASVSISRDGDVLSMGRMLLGHPPEHQSHP